MADGSCPIGEPSNDSSIQSEPIAIVGIGCRLPGCCSSPSQLWELLIKEESGHCEVPPTRYNAEGFYHPDAERPGSINSKGGYFIQEDIHTFENAFFNINNLESKYMDPQQRKLLEVVYESFENAGCLLENLKGSNTGVYIGNFTNDFMIMQYSDPEYFSRYSATGAAPTILANRISHCFDLRGPSVVLDTACSSSLYALHSACLALDAYDCDAAVVASANLIQIPDQQIIAVKAGILSPDSTCHTFDEAANGYGRAEAVCSLYLKRLCDAVRDNDPVRAVIRGTSVNGNGRTPGIVQPSAKGQEAVIRAAYRRARLPMNATPYVEAHGTGTKIGDPIEIEAIANSFDHKAGIPILVGGIKPTLGHSEGASAISSIIKVVLALEKGVIPATIGVKNINPNVKTVEWNVEIATSSRKWPYSLMPRASVNSFGFGGANSHAILESAPARDPTLSNHAGLTNGNRILHEDSADRKCRLLTFSARTNHSLTKLVENIAKYISQAKYPIILADLCYTLNCRRSQLAIRGFLTVSSSSLLSDLNLSRLVTRSASSYAKLPFSLVYTGQGSQWSGMGSGLIDQYAVFKKSIRYLDACLQTFKVDERPTWSIEATLSATKEGPGIDFPERSQTITTAVQIALTDLLYDWGVLPNVVFGHSSGEIGAAYAAGHLNAWQAIATAFCRGFTVSRNHHVGAMVAVGLGQSQANDAIIELALHEKCCVACINSPESCTISGDEAAIERLQEVLVLRKVFVRRLKTGGKAYHSYHMKAVGPSYQSLLESVWKAPNSSTDGIHDYHLQDNKALSAEMISTVTARNVDAVRVRSSAYWRENLESPVMFYDVVKSIMERGQYHFIEVGPHSSLELPIKQTATALGRTLDNYIYDSILYRGKDAVCTTLGLVGNLFLHRHDEILIDNLLADESMLLPRKSKVLIDLPTYPWDYSSSIPPNEPRCVTEFRTRKYPRHDLLGSQIPGGNRMTVSWRNKIDINEVIWLQDHRLGPSIIFPAAAYLAMAVEAMCQVSGLGLSECPGIDMRNVNFIKALDFHEELKTSVELFSEMRQMPISSVTSSKRWWQFNVVSIAQDNAHTPTVHANCLVSLATPLLTATRRQIRLTKATMEQQATRVWYDKFTQEGLNWGPAFAVIKEIFCDRARQAHHAAATTQLVRCDRNSLSGESQYIAHPISLDSMLQTAFVATTGAGSEIFALWCQWL